jgi:hypothetical protein
LNLFLPDHRNDALVRGSLFDRFSLRVNIHRAPGTCMPHKLLNDLDVLTITDKHCRKAVTERIANRSFSQFLPALRLAE